MVDPRQISNIDIGATAFKHLNVTHQARFDTMQFSSGAHLFQQRSDSHCYLLPHGGAAGPHGCKLRWHRQSFGPWAGLGEGQAWVVDPGGHDARCAAHLLGQEDGAVGQLVGLSTGLLPHGNLLGQELLALGEKGGEDKRGGRYRANVTHTHTGRPQGIRPPTAS